ncbi:EamA-like transporter family protein [Vibrio ruber DSM 16370]|uniref:EamA-like transporter family protein n=1 Tax=Vibrio ruber (strain DSM 16370 / JCM 11486 / BCRC 17186 / CECT 7878 / LMG 23124 / VR1) TaxID=1123498 RepID=A0A1R4LNZ3_VIBR1|nr:DMT family transporter [Vibrio ruber]SJN58300.1 EamA-like transporter family protein [Vibrio ruber DSM 16370]
MWILVTLFAATCQSIRTAYQKTLSQEQGFLHATMARSLYGLPIVSIYLLICWYFIGQITFPSIGQFLGYASVCAIAQVLATYLMLRVFQSGSFALGTLLAKTEAVLAALIGIPLLHNSLNLTAWSGIALGVTGTLVMSMRLGNLRHAHKDMSLLAGLGSGLCFAVTSVTASLASHSLQGSIITSAGVTIWYVLALQSVLLCSLQIYRSGDLFSPVKQSFLLSSKVGILSSLGSIGWFTGFALINPALVKTLGQIEILGTLYFSKRRFNEQMTLQQWIGGSMIVGSVILVAVATL